jgi:ABC-2 type transport system ATP-binding protein
MGKHVRYLTGTHGKQTRPKVVEIHQLTLRQNQQARLHEITLDIFEGESVALVGSSAADKQALLACLLGQIRPDQGEIRVFNTALPPLPPDLHRQIGVLPRSVEYLAHETIAAYLQRFACTHRVQLTLEQTAAYCEHYQLRPSAQITALTHLQARVLSLAAALVHDPRLVLLAEPLADLNAQEQALIQDYLQRIQREGRTLLCTFSPPLAENHFTGYDLLVRLEQGQLLHQEH